MIEKCLTCFGNFASCACPKPTSTTMLVRENEETLLAPLADGRWVTTTGKEVAIKVGAGGCAYGVAGATLLRWNARGRLAQAQPPLPEPRYADAARLAAPIGAWRGWGAVGTPPIDGRARVEWRTADGRITRGCASMVDWRRVCSFRMLGNGPLTDGAIVAHAPVGTAITVNREIARGLAPEAARAGLTVREALRDVAAAVNREVVRGIVANVTSTLADLKVTRVEPFPPVAPRAPGAWPPPSHRWRYRPGFPEAS